MGAIVAHLQEFVMCKSMASTWLDSIYCTFVVRSSLDEFNFLYARIGAGVRISATLSITLIPFMHLRTASKKHLFAPELVFCSTENQRFACRKFCRGGMQVAHCLTQRLTLKMRCDVRVEV